LLARAGLLPHYDSLPRTGQSLSQTLGTLRAESATVSGQAAQEMGQHVEALAVALHQKMTLVEYFTSDNALLQNSLTYLTYAGQTLGPRVEGEPVVAADIAALSHVLLRFIHTPEPSVGQEVGAALDRLSQTPLFPQDFHTVSKLQSTEIGIPSQTPLFPQDFHTLVAHGRLIMEVLPQVDTLLRQIIAAPTAAYAAAFQDAVLQYADRVEARAQRFRVLLYLVAVMLLGYLLYQFARLQANARDLRHANADLQREMGERQQAVGALRTSEERFRAITESANDAIISADSSGHIVSWNAWAEAIFGYTAEEILGAPLTHLMPARDHAAHVQRFTQWSATGSSRLVGTTVEFVGVRKDGGEFPLEISLSTWSTAHGHYVTGIIRDLTAHKQLQETTRQQRMQLIQANKMTALGTLVSGVAHEINNPNQVILMNSGVLAKAWDDAVGILDTYERENGAFALGGLPYTEMRDTIPALVRDVHDGARRIERIIDDLKDFARPRVRGVRTVVQLNDAVQRALRLLAHLIKQHTDHFHVDLAPGLPSLRGDAQHVEQNDGDERSGDRRAVYANRRQRLSGEAGGREPAGLVGQARLRASHLAGGSAVPERTSADGDPPSAGSLRRDRHSKQGHVCHLSVSRGHCAVTATGLDDRGNRHGQGARGAGAASALGTPGRACGGQCGGPGRYDVLGYLVRPYQGRVYQRRPSSGRRDHEYRRGHPVPRRDRRPVSRIASQITASPAGWHLLSPRRRSAAAEPRPDHMRHQC
jgi:PAS domain S-box-containing protein